MRAKYLGKKLAGKGTERHGTRSQSRKQAVHVEETLALVLSGGQLVDESSLAIGSKARQAGEVLATL